MAYYDAGVPNCAGNEKLILLLNPPQPASIPAPLAPGLRPPAIPVRRTATGRSLGIPVPATQVITTRDPRRVQVGFDLILL